MKRFTSFLLLLIPIVLQAQDTINTLIISEIRLAYRNYNAYCELTNIGEEAIDLHVFEFGGVNPYDYEGPDTKGIMLGDYIDKYVPSASDKTILESGESIWLSIVYDLAREKYKQNPVLNHAPYDLDGLWDADIVLHALEDSTDSRDSISADVNLIQLYAGNYIFLKQHQQNGNVVLIDLVSNGRDFLGSSSPSLSVAGYRDAL